MPFTQDNVNTLTSTECLVQLCKPNILRAGVSSLHDVRASLDLQGKEVVPPSNSDAGLDGDELGQVYGPLLLHLALVRVVGEVKHLPTKEEVKETVTSYS